MSEPVSLAARRAEKEGNSGAWTPLDALEEAVRRVKSGELALDKVVVLGVEDTGRLTLIRAGTTHESTVALFEVAKVDAIREWQEG